MIYWILIGGITLLSVLVQRNLTNKFEKYSKMYLSNRLTGKEIAELMLQKNNINNVSVNCINGTLTDHYNPSNQTVNLSEGVYQSNSLAAAAVAAHECGHVLQHASGYAFIKMRSSLVPAVSFASKWSQWVILAGLLLINYLGTSLLIVGIAMYAIMTLFSFITLPVEIDASRRAVNWLSETGIVSSQDLPIVKDALKSAAYTYVVAAIGSLATLLYYISRVNDRK